MNKSRLQIVGFLRQAEAGMAAMCNASMRLSE